ncbi:MAG TPA: SDR family NAD(P)-dependent oxidoreductase [Terriglobales bacterium]|nr:SDR family NAD(P)-dependent oxidoreductase [Terriglobales bacterium]
MPGSPERKVGIITGAGRGIGLAIADAMARAGFDVLLTARSVAQLKSAAKRLESHGTRVLAEACDVRDPRSVRSLFSAAKREFKGIDVLVNNAGYAGPEQNVDEMSLEEWRTTLDTNLTGTFLCTQAALPLMRRGSTIVNNLSVAAKGGFPGMAAYVASKHGLMGFSITLRAELRPRGIRVIALMPGATDTEIWKQFWPDAPRSRMMSPASVAGAVVNAILLPENATVEELVIAPTGGAL